MLGILERPVQIIELNLTKFHFGAVGFQKPGHDFAASVRGKAQMPNPPVFLLLHQIGENAILLVEICIDVHFADIMKQLEVKICHAAFLKLTLKDFCDFRHV